ncbi:uncharacterized protein N7515_006367 [Penicillium bovifimosum]|uniref:F-box domain-containing protein n=1 Tax=Penicillium bovifimosum TaxID=126998 RepID=A0A9W9GUW6_9EURO|nr:uncharacterized protein N7515_006367 [Penicillium bovifimosum]KAJ5130328.1 hypothetical protein N7515_006367 [Penicillium bovifimosum]
MSIRLGGSLRFPLEIWDMIIEQLKHEESAQHLGRLAQTCHVLHQRTVPRLYSLVRLSNSESGAHLAVAIEQRPELAELIHEIRHKEDSGLEVFSGRHLKFYKMAAGLPNVETLILRGKLRPHKATQYTSYQARTPYGAYPVVKLARTVKEYRDLGVGPPGQSQFSPPDTPTIPWEFDRGNETLFGHALLQNPPGMPALRVCHIGSDRNLCGPSNARDCPCIPRFNEAIFRHPGLRVLCIRGAIFQPVESASYPLRRTDTPLEDLTLLKCTIQASDLEILLEHPQALKRFTWRGAYPLPAEDDPEIEYVVNDYVAALVKHRDSLEYIDYDLEWGSEDAANFSIFTNVKHLTVALKSLAGEECTELDPEYDLLPENLESLTIHYDELKYWVPQYIFGLVEDKQLPNLRLFACTVRSTSPDAWQEKYDNFSVEPTKPPRSTHLCRDIDTWQPRFEAFNVELRTEILPFEEYPTWAPKYKLCPCDQLWLFHRIPLPPIDL